MLHTFQFDPYAILGIRDGASLREIRDAYHQKSKKHHPDVGGDEWAFRVVARAYEILSTARVVDRSLDITARANASARAEPASDFTAPPPPPPPPQAEAAWSRNFEAGPGAAATSANTGATLDPEAVSNLTGWGENKRSHVGEAPAVAGKYVAAELLILRFELECSLDLFALNPEDRNLSCSLHVSWPVEEVAEHPAKIPGSARTLKVIGDAFKSRAVRKHALTKQAHTIAGRFDGWITYPTAVMASDALEALRAELATHDLTLEKQIREMAIPRPSK
jgi:hypothetical protein